jgi:Uma2 family endonuclease
MRPGPNLRRFTIGEFHRLRELGVLSESEHLELLDGMLVTMTPIGLRRWHRHSAVVAFLIEALGERAAVLPQAALPLGEFDEPRPDIAVVAVRPGEPLQRPPAPEAILALVELADTSFSAATGIKRKLYARFGILDYLIVDLEHSVVLHFGESDLAGEPQPVSLTYGDTLRLRALDVELRVDAFLAPRS